MIKSISMRDISSHIQKSPFDNGLSSYPFLNHSTDSDWK